MKAGFATCLLSGCLGLSLLVVSGCGGGQGNLSGRVLYNGSPLPGGRVTFRPADSRQNSVSAEIDREGKYAAILPSGEVKICVDNRELEPPPLIDGGPPMGLPPEVRQKLAQAAPKEKAQRTRAERAADQGRYVPIPNRYYEIETSGLTFKVRTGSQEHDIVLTK